MTLTDILLQEAASTYAITECLFRRIHDSELSWKPPTGTNWMTVGQLLIHCACFGCGKAVHGFVTGEWELPDDIDSENPGQEVHVPPAEVLPSVTRVQQAIDFLAEDRNLTLRTIADAGDESMLQKMICAPWGGPECTLFQHLLHMVDHLAQHKGQLFYYMKLMGKDVNTSDLWGD